MFYLSEIDFENLSIEWEHEDGGRFWVTYDNIDEFNTALGNIQYGQ